MADTPAIEETYSAVCPSPSQLSVSSDPVACVECARPFKNAGALRFHMVKSHCRVSTGSDSRIFRGRNVSPKKKEHKRYLCPIDICKFSNRQSTKFFRSLSALKEHYLKVHKERTLLCSKCKQAWFSLEKSLRYHEKNCRLGDNTTESAAGPDLVAGPTAPLPTLIIIKPAPVVVRKVRPPVALPRLLLPKPARTDACTQSDHACESRRSVAMQCDAAGDQPQATSGHRDASCSAGEVWPLLFDPVHFQGACYAANSDGATTAQSEAVECNDFFCQTCVIPTADAAVSADFRVSTTTIGQQCQLLYSPPDEYRPAPSLAYHQFDSEQNVEDANSTWANNETQTDIAMVEFDDLFADVAWNDMETQT